MSFSRLMGYEVPRQVLKLFITTYLCSIGTEVDTDHSRLSSVVPIKDDDFPMERQSGYPGGGATS